MSRYLRERLEEADRRQAQLLAQLADERQRADVLTLRAIGGGPLDVAQDAPGQPETSEPGPTGIWTWVKRLWGG